MFQHFFQINDYISAYFPSVFWGVLTCVNVGREWPRAFVFGEGRGRAEYKVQSSKNRSQISEVLIWLFRLESSLTWPDFYKYQLPMYIYFYYYISLYLSFMLFSFWIIELTFLILTSCLLCLLTIVKNIYASLTSWI